MDVPRPTELKEFVDVPYLWSTESFSAETADGDNMLVPNHREQPGCLLELMSTTVHNVAWNLR